MTDHVYDDITTTYVYDDNLLDVVMQILLVWMDGCEWMWVIVDGQIWMWGSVDEQVWMGECGWVWVGEYIMDVINLFYA